MRAPYDVILVGAGLANGLIALRLRQLQPALKVLLLESQAQPPAIIHGHFTARTSAKRSFAGSSRCFRHAGPVIRYASPPCVASWMVNIAPLPRRILPGTCSRCSVPRYAPQRRSATSHPPESDWRMAGCYRHRR